MVVVVVVVVWCSGGGDGGGGGVDGGGGGDDLHQACNRHDAPERMARRSPLPCCSLTLLLDLFKVTAFLRAFLPWSTCTAAVSTWYSIRSMISPWN